MALMMPMKLERICRTCMTDTSIFHSLFDFVDDYKHEKVQICELLTQTIHKLPKIEVISDELPKNICTNCLETVQKFYEFQNCCIDSDFKLRKQFMSSHALVNEKEQLDPLTESALHIEEQIKQECDEDYIVNSKSGVGTVSSIEKQNTDFFLSSKVESEDETEFHNFESTMDESEQAPVELCEPTILEQKALNKRRSTAKGRTLKAFSDTKKDETKFSTRAKIKTCELCDLNFKTAMKLLDHYTSAHPERLNSDELLVPIAIKHIFCPYCKKGMKNLKNHLHSHTKERPFLCSHCGKGFGNSSGLKQHSLRHTDEKRYACTECPKRFAVLSNLCIHRRIHQQEKSHVCDVCGNSFKRKDSLNEHKRTHDTDRKFKCEHCSKDFGALKHLRRHILTHTGEKPYKCKFCPRSFSQSNDMIKHLRTHLGENVYQCELCPAAFPKAGERRLHFATHKNDDEATREQNKQALIEAQEKLRQNLQLDKSSANSSINV